MSSERRIARRHTRIERHRTSATLRTVELEVDVVGEEAFFVFSNVLPRRKKQNADTNFNGSVNHRFLEAHVGRPWDEVYSILRRRFSARSYIDLRLIGWVKRMVGMSCGTLRSFFVDEDGILRKTATQSRPKNKEVYFGKISEKFEAWTEGRKFIARGSKHFWCVGHEVVLDPVRVHCKDPSCSRFHEYSVDESGRIQKFCVEPKGFRQDREFEPEDYAFFATLPARLKKGYR